MVLPIGVNDFFLLMATCLFILGMLSICLGIYLLATRVGGKDVKAIAVQASRLAQKGIAEDVSGLVGNASSLVSALNDLVKTTTGIGIFLVLVGFILIGSAFFLAKQIH